MPRHGVMKSFQKKSTKSEILFFFIDLLEIFTFKNPPTSGWPKRSRAFNAPAEARLQVNTHPARVKTNKRVSPRKLEGHSLSHWREVPG